MAYSAFHLSAGSVRGSSLQRHKPDRSEMEACLLQVLHACVACCIRAETHVLALQGAKHLVIHGDLVRSYGPHLHAAVISHNNAAAAETRMVAKCESERLYVALHGTTSASLKAALHTWRRVCRR